jgi:hypothetical protein
MTKRLLGRTPTPKIDFENLSPLEREATTVVDILQTYRRVAAMGAQEGNRGKRPIQLFCEAVEEM